jgi:mono/diheme cytochrome c family protein
MTLFTVWWLHGTALFAQSPRIRELKLNTGKEVYEAACVACHGPDGKGMPESTLGFKKPETFPDFTDCNGTVRERNADWRATIHEGGPGRGFSEIMPSFADALTLEQIEKVMQHLRGFCKESDWPRGELNLPRALVTDKAFPEDEAVLTTTVNATGAATVTNQIVYERRFGVLNQIEVAVPFSVQRQDTGAWFGGVGDLTLGYKRVLFHHLGSDSGSIVSVSGEASLPTGNKSHGLGSGVTTFETFATYGQLLPSKSFVQLQSGVELPTDTKDTPRAVFWRAAAGKTLTDNKGFGRIWTPMVEFLADRDLEAGAKTNWDLVPQFQVSLSKRQHIMANAGVRVPMNNTTARSVTVMFYLLWDWFDGGLRQGWK